MYTTIRVQQWPQVREIADKLIMWGFRGHENASWDLETTLHRVANVYNHPIDMLWHREYWMVRQFHRRAHHYCNYLPAYDQKLDWLALMQHYGAPTRLLDFSHSLYIAAFFALERAVTDAAIWAVNLEALRRLIAKYFEADTSKENMDMTNQRHIQVANECICVDGKDGRNQYPIILCVEPEQLHQRLLVQQGFFLFQGDISRPFKDVLSSFVTSSGYSDEQQDMCWDGTEEKKYRICNNLMLKIIIPKNCIRDGIDDLNKMNINAATLFPGLDGFARSMLYNFSAFPDIEGIFKKKKEPAIT